jgi:hypothetical protein
VALWHLSALALVAAGAGLAAGWTARDWKAGADELERVQQAGHDARRAGERVDGAAVAHEADKVRIQVVREIVTKETDRAIAADPDWYAGECLDPDGLRSVAAALGASAALTGEPSPSLPGSSPTR